MATRQFFCTRGDDVIVPVVVADHSSELGWAGTALVCKFLVAEAAAEKSAAAPVTGMAREGSPSPA